MAAPITVRYWAGARAVTGIASERYSWDETCAGGCTVADLLDVAVGRHPAAERVLAVASIIVDGISVTRGHRIGPGAVIEVLPPFAGG
jgi:molybdopterin synthase sulfur carrier subunit